MPYCLFSICLGTSKDKTCFLLPFSRIISWYHVPLLFLNLHTHIFFTKADFFQTHGLFPVMFPLLFALCEKAAVCFCWNRTRVNHRFGVRDCVKPVYIQTFKEIAISQDYSPLAFTQELSVDFPQNKQHDWICFSHLKASAIPCCDMQLAMAELSLLQDTTYHLQNTIVTGDVSQPVTWRWLGVKGRITQWLMLVERWFP